MDKNILNRQSQHWETNFSNKPEMFGLEPSLPAKKALNIFKENNYSKIVELGAGLGRDSIYFGKNLINVFVPTTPNPTSGFLLMFPIEDVIYLNMTFEEASKFIVSAGTSTKNS